MAASTTRNSSAVRNRSGILSTSPVYEEGTSFRGASHTRMERCSGPSITSAPS